MVKSVWWKKNPPGTESERLVESVYSNRHFDWTSLTLFVARSMIES